MSRIFTRLGFTAVAIIAGAVPAVAQGTQTATLIGEVVDKAGAPVVGAEVRLTSDRLQGQRVVVSDAKGRFIARLLPPGDYKIQIAKGGFTTIARSERLGLEQNLNTRFTMASEFAAVVEVVGYSAQQDKTEFKSSTNYNKEKIDALPVDRNPLNVALMAPGVVENVNSDRGGMQIHGSQGSGNLWLLDGQNYADNVYNGPRAKFVTDAIDEVQVITGAIPAEFGDVEGGVVNTITKSGGDEFTAQLRYDLTNQNWNAVKHGQSAKSLVDKVNQERVFQIGGPIIKSKLWFYASYFSTTASNNKTLPGDQIDAVGAPADAPYSENIKDIRRQIKLTWAINQDHTLVFTNHNYRENFGNIDYWGSGDGNFDTRRFTQDIYGLQLRSLLTSNLTMSFKIGKKEQVLAVGSNTVALPLVGINDGYIYKANIFDNRDPGDIRNNQTANLKFSYFGDWQGNHVLDFGLDYYHGKTIAMGSQAPVDLVIGGKAWNSFVNFNGGLDLTNNTINIDPASMPYTSSYFSMPGEGSLDQISYYVNDKWSLNKKWNFNIGLRLDTFDGKDKATGKKNASNSALSPRLGANFDPFGDSQWIFGAAFSRYNGKPLEAILNVASYVNNPIYASFQYNGPTGLQPISVLSNPANYDPAYTAYTDASVNVKLNPHIKMQTVDEYQVSASRNFRVDWLGEGYIKVTRLVKTWNNLIDYSAGNNGTVADPGGGAPLYVTYWNNNPDAKRFYRSTELEGSVTKGNLVYGGNIVWSTLEGNYNGEGRATPGSGQGLNFFTVQDGVKMYDTNVLNPRGYLRGHTPLRIRLNVTYKWVNPLGTLSTGLLHRFDSGSHLDQTRSLDPALLNPSLSSQFGSNAVQFYNNDRGQIVPPSLTFTDLSLQQDFNLLKLPGNRNLAAYVRLQVTNVFNHQQFGNTALTGGSIPTGFKAATSLNSPWIASSYGTQPSNNWAAPRTILISTGFKF